MTTHEAWRFPVVVWLVLVLLAAGLSACAPSAEDCRDLMPFAAATAVPARTPADTRGCRATREGVLFQVEAVRRNLRWERGRIWIDGLEATETDLSSAMAAARARHNAARLGSRAGQALRAIRDAARAFRDTLKGRTQPAQPPPSR